MKKLRVILSMFLVIVFSMVTFAGCGSKKEDKKTQLSAEDIAITKVQEFLKNAKNTESEYGFSVVYKTVEEGQEIEDETYTNVGKVKSQKTNEGNFITKINMFDKVDGTREYYEIQEYNGFSIVYNYYQLNFTTSYDSFPKFYDVKIYSSEDEDFEMEYPTIHSSLTLFENNYKNIKQSANKVEIKASNENGVDVFTITSEYTYMDKIIYIISTLKYNNDRVLNYSVLEKIDEKNYSSIDVQYDYFSKFTEIDKTGYILNNFNIEKLIKPLDFGETNFKIEWEKQEENINGKNALKEEFITYLNTDGELEQLAIVDKNNYYKEYYQTIKFANQYLRKTFAVGEGTYTQDYLTEEEYNSNLTYHVNGVINLIDGIKNKTDEFLNKDLIVKFEDKITVTLTYSYVSKKDNDKISSGEIIYVISDSKIENLSISEINHDEDLIVAFDYKFTYGVVGNLNASAFEDFILK